MPEFIFLLMLCAALLAVCYAAIQVQPTQTVKVKQAGPSDYVLEYCQYQALRHGKWPPSCQDMVPPGKIP